jgi:hypothetical protein
MVPAWSLLMEFLAGQHVRGENPLAIPSLTTFGDSFFEVAEGVL